MNLESGVLKRACAIFIIYSCTDKGFVILQTKWYRSESESPIPPGNMIESRLQAAATVDNVIINCVIKWYEKGLPLKV